MRNPRKAAAEDGSSSTSNIISKTMHAAPPLHTEEPQHLTIVVKLGSSSIVNEDDFQPQLALLSSIAETVCTLRRKGHRVVLVSSGAIAMGLKRMEMRAKPKILAEKQALAAIGQGRLIALWDTLFGMLGQPIAQVLLTRSDISDRSRYLNSTKTLSALLSYGVIPIVNENDTVSVSEIKFGDNDTLSAITASMIGADYLFLLTDVDCLYTDNPRRFPDTAKQVRIVRDIENLRSMISTSTMGSNLGTGGMETKIIAAELANGAGVSTVITHGKKPENILAIVNHPITSHGMTDEEYEQITPLHTVFIPEEEPLPDKRWWVLHGLKPRGRIIIDEGAYRAIARSTVNPSSASSTATPQAETPPLASSPSSSNPPVIPSTPLSQSTITPTGSAVPSPSLLATTSARPLSIPRSTSRSHTATSSGNGGRLLPAGVIAVEGTFAAGQAVTVVVQRRRRNNRRSTDGCSLEGGRRGNGSSHGNNRSGSSSLANSLILEQAKQVGDPYATSEEAPHATTHQNSASSTSKYMPKDASKQTSNTGSRRKKSDRNTNHFSDTEFGADTTTDDDDSNEVEEQIEFGRGLANYNYQEIDRIKGHKSSEIEKMLGYIESEHCVESITSLKRLEL